MATAATYAPVPAHSAPRRRRLIGDSATAESQKAGMALNSGLVYSIRLSAPATAPPATMSRAGAVPSSPARTSRA
ncbi:hypothetical protein [Actinomadura madurae]|uniref:hypothetical protein n=1 Tax=Actinomadura madurae TaxID=1993 RepID=UPI0020D25F74|nr:hypothetical protein [Actinomadura madurae]MCP9954945.1 hypothetical protein [Actinomadura madurae]MCQ0020389.1 hypothetical protein [Actinomadura madurae]